MTPQRLLALGIVDLAVAFGAGILAFRAFGANACADTNPPVCSNAWGHVVPSTRDWGDVVPLAFGAVLVALVVAQALWLTSRRRTRGTRSNR